LNPGPDGPEPCALPDTLDTVLTAFILVKANRQGLTQLGSELAAVEGVAEVYTVTGEWDFIAIVRVREHDDLAKVVTQHLTRLDGVERTQTMVAFQQFSAHDLEAMFGLGLEDKKA
jgi:DNA-binding Lrp family transcriptional regulator